MRAGLDLSTMLQRGRRLEPEALKFWGLGDVGDFTEGYYLVVGVSVWGFRVFVCFGASFGDAGL